MNFKSGYVAASKMIGDQWVVRFDRAEPGDKPKSFYVKLLIGSNPPKETEFMKFPRLKRLEDQGGFDWYEELPVEMKGTTTRITGDKAEEVEMEDVKPATQKPNPNVLLISASILAAGDVALESGINEAMEIWNKIMEDQNA
jgi:hypothetical protein